MIASAVTFKLSAAGDQQRYVERERVSRVVCGTIEELVGLTRTQAGGKSIISGTCFFALRSLCHLV